MLAQHGFRSGVTTEDLPNRIGGDPFALKRKVLWENFSRRDDGRLQPRALTVCQLDDCFGMLGMSHPVLGKRPPARRGAGEAQLQVEQQRGGRLTKNACNEGDRILPRQGRAPGTCAVLTAILTSRIPLVLARRLSLAGVRHLQAALPHRQRRSTSSLPFGMVQSLYFFMPRAEQKRPYFVHSAGLCCSPAGRWPRSDLRRPADQDGATTSTTPTLAQYVRQLALYTCVPDRRSPLEISLTRQGRTKASAACYLVSDRCARWRWRCRCCSATACAA